MIGMLYIYFNMLDRASIFIRSMEQIGDKERRAFFHSLTLGIIKKNRIHNKTGKPKTD
jgi:hypothetical protein